RNINVTRVQTCALPTSTRTSAAPDPGRRTTPRGYRARRGPTPGTAALPRCTGSGTRPQTSDPPGEPVRGELSPLALHQRQARGAPVLSRGERRLPRVRARRVLLSHHPGRSDLRPSRKRRQQADKWSVLDFESMPDRDREPPVAPPPTTTVPQDAR